MTILCLLVLVSCGKDKLNASLNKTQNGLSSGAKECNYTSLGPPVCAYLPTDKKDHDYENAQLAECFGAQVKHEGHCSCEANPIQVCAEDGNSYSECEAKQKNLKVVKYVPCSAQEQ